MFVLFWEFVLLLKNMKHVTRVFRTISLSVSCFFFSFFLSLSPLSPTRSQRQTNEVCWRVHVLTNATTRESLLLHCVALYNFIVMFLKIFDKVLGKKTTTDPQWRRAITFYSCMIIRACREDISFHWEEINAAFYLYYLSTCLTLAGACPAWMKETKKLPVLLIHPFLSQQIVSPFYNVELNV